MLGMPSFFAGFHPGGNAGTFTYQFASGGGTDMATGQPRQLVLTMNVTHETSQNYTLIKLHLFNDRTNQDVHFVTYQLGIVKNVNSRNGTAAAENDDIAQIKSPLLLDLFQTQGAIMTLKIIYDPTVAANTTIAATREPFFNAAQADPGGVITIRTPFIKPEGSYLLYAKILTMDYPANIITNEEAPEAVFPFDGRDVVREVHLVPGCIVTASGATLPSIKGSGSEDPGPASGSNDGSNAIYTGNCKPTSSALIPQPAQTKEDIERLKAADIPALEYARGYKVSHNVAVSGENVYAVWEKDIAGIYPYITVSKLFFAASHDEGRTFSKATNITGNDIHSGSPHIAGWKDNVYVLYTTAGIRVDQFGVGFVASHDGGKTFDPPLYLDNESNGAVATIRHSSYNASIYHESTQPVMAASGKNVYVAWLDNTNGVEHVIFIVSHDEGRTFEPTVALENNFSNLGNLVIATATQSSIPTPPSPVSAANAAPHHAHETVLQKSDGAAGSNNDDEDNNNSKEGDVYVAWAGRVDKNSPSDNVIAIAASHDEGRTFERSSYSALPNEGSLPMDIQGMQMVAAATTAGKYLYFTWLNSNQYNSYVYFARSTDGGASIEQPFILGRHYQDHYAQQLVAVGSDVYVVWQGASSEPNPRTFGLFLASSHDKGENFGDAVRVGPRAGDSLVIDPQVLPIGRNLYVVWDEANADFLGISTDGGKTFQKPIVLSP